MPNPNSDMIQFVSRRSFNVIQYGAAKNFYKEPFVNFGLLVFDLGGIGCFFGEDLFLHIVLYSDSR